MYHLLLPDIPVQVLQCFGAAADHVSHVDLAHAERFRDRKQVPGAHEVHDDEDGILFFVDVMRAHEVLKGIMFGTRTMTSMLAFINEGIPYASV